MKTLGLVVMGLLALMLALVLGLYFAMKAALAPLPGEWATQVSVEGIKFQAGVPSLVRLSTAPWFAPLLHGKTLPTRAGPVQVAWRAGTQTLALRCAPCTLRARGLGAEPLVLQSVELTVVHRLGDQLSGEVSAGKLRAQWQGQWVKATGGAGEAGMTLRMQLPMTPIADGYALLASSIPEAAQARIEGNFAINATLKLPEGDLNLVPQLEGFQVSGLGTEAFANAQTSCKPNRLSPESWLARAVLAAEDQRFYQHTGYDLAEFNDALTRNQAGKNTLRGASTLTQQLAKLLITGDERSPVRKLRELLYAVEMEQTLGKNRILRLYLASAPWGAGLCGAEAAAQRYFGLPAHKLNPTQAAWLAAMLHNPAMEARGWRETSQINVARTQWVLLGMRPMARSQRVKLAEGVPQLMWNAPADGL
jgi:monofunctional glycosyltransferase